LSHSRENIWSQEHLPIGKDLAAGLHGYETHAISGIFGQNRETSRRISLGRGSFIGQWGRRLRAFAEPVLVFSGPRRIDRGIPIKGR
jgi:hypothetical protein